MFINGVWHNQNFHMGGTELPTVGSFVHVIEDGRGVNGMFCAEVVAVDENSFTVRTGSVQAPERDFRLQLHNLVVWEDSFYPA